ncbi:catalase family protein [Sphingomonas bacterium]|uniref:catalase family protein n=1 Tax=Sphingomonas bacterium TaxID=1895847 RepID=UPI0015751A25|nr:catalase family protein [Sphingomonas bacterium]
MSQPVRYSADVEKVEPGEGDTIRQLREQFKLIQDTTSKDYDHAVRAVHAKAHGIAKGRLTVKDDLPPELAQGIFAQAGSFDAVLRISTNAGDILDDDIGLPRGLALKVMGVEGERLPGSEDETSQDFIMVNGPVFSAPDASAFLKNLKLLAKTTDRGMGAKKVLSTLLHATNTALTAVGVESPTIQQLGGAPQVHPLGETYYSQTPYRFGDYIARWQLVPVSPELTGFTKEVVDTAGRPDALREEVRRGLVEGGGTWELRVQLNTNLDAMPIEDPTKPWDEKESPFRTVAMLAVPAQISWEHGESDRLDNTLSFNIWRGVAAHQPLGGINRARNDTYRQSTSYRRGFNGCPMHEPQSIAELESAG